MITKHLIDAVSTMAPILGNLLGGPIVGKLAGNLIASVFGESDPVALVAKIADHPDAKSILQSLETKYAPMLGLIHGMQMPSKVEISVKLEFPNPSPATE